MNPIITPILNVLGKLFNFLKAERDPDKQQKRRFNYEYRVLKEAVKVAVDIYQYERILETERHPQRRKAYKRKIQGLWATFFKLLARE